LLPYLLHESTRSTYKKASIQVLPYNKVAPCGIAHQEVYLRRCQIPLDQQPFAAKLPTSRSSINARPATRHVLDSEKDVQ
jgi:hypothetical protein